MRAEPKRGKGFGGTILTLLLTALVVGGSFLAAALMEYTIPRESDETVELGDIREPVVYPAGDLKHSLYPWSNYDETKCRALTSSEEELLQWFPEFLSQMMETDFFSAGLTSLFRAVTQEETTYFFINEAAITDAGGRRYTLDCAAEQGYGLVYFTCRPEEEIPEEQWRYAYRSLENFFASWKTDKELPGITVPIESDEQYSKEQSTFVQSLEWFGMLANRYPLYRFQKLVDFFDQAEVLLTDSDLMVINSGYQMNVLFIDPQTCRIIGCGSAA